METLSILIFSLFCIGEQELPIYSACVVDSNDYRFHENLESYQDSEMWGLWATKIGRSYSSPETDSSARAFSTAMVEDYDLTTYWKSKEGQNGIGEYFAFEFQYDEVTKYASAYQFQGICNLFNGNCSTEESWLETSRVKKLKVYYNDIPLCYVELVDTWHFQAFDIGHFFVNRLDHKYLYAEQEIVNGDTLKFEIIEVYPGSRYPEVAIAGFYAEGAGN